MSEIKDKKRSKLEHTYMHHDRTCCFLYGATDQISNFFFCFVVVVNPHLRILSH